MVLSFPPPPSSSRHRTPRHIIIFVQVIVTISFLKIFSTAVLLAEAAVSATTSTTAIPSSFVCLRVPVKAFSSSSSLLYSTKKEKHQLQLHPFVISMLVKDDDSNVYCNERRNAQLHNSSYKQSQQMGRKEFIQSSFLLFSSFLAVQPSPSNAIPQSKKSPSASLEDALDQIDLAVQASSVQAWEEASTLIYDEILNESNLAKVFESTKMQKDLEKQKIILECIQNMRGILSFQNNDGNKKGLSTEDAMSVMKYGTNARTALKGSMR